MTPLPPTLPRQIRGVFCDIDGTLTTGGRIPAVAYNALWALHDAGLRVIPVTGRPAGWVDHVARMWPVHGVVGENGGLWAWQDGPRVRLEYLQPPDARREHRDRLLALQAELLAAFPGTALASDQPYRALDLAIDFAEDVPDLGLDVAERIAAHFEAAGATAKVSHIHVNGWFGDFDKLTGCRRLVADAFREDLDQTLEDWLYVGDSANDEPMFAHFPHSVGVANVQPFLSRMASHPRWITPSEGGEGFNELVQVLLAARSV